MLFIPQKTYLQFAVQRYEKKLKDRNFGKFWKPKEMKREKRKLLPCTPL